MRPAAPRAPDSQNGAILQKLWWLSMMTVWLSIVVLLLRLSSRRRVAEVDVGRPRRC